MSFENITFITGFEKNSGKTTFLNYLLSGYTSQDKVLCISIGVDYELKSFLDEGYKPKLLIKKGWKALTNSLFLNSFNFLYRINEVYDYNVIGGRPLIITPEYDSYIKLASPGPNFPEIIKDFPEYKIFVDGAFDRITQIGEFEGSSFYYVFKVNAENLERVKHKIKLLDSFMQVKISKKEYDVIDSMNEEFKIVDGKIYFKGALTELKLEKISKNISTIIISDFTRVFLNYEQWKKLTDKFEVFFTRGFKFCGYVINLYDISMKDFEAGFDKNVVLKFIYNPYEYRKVL